MQNIPLFGSAASLIAPPGGTVTSGYFPLQYYPAENLNYYLNAETQAIQELITVINFAGLSPSSSTNQLLASISGLLNSAFQFGTYVNKVAITQPASLATLTIGAGKTLEADQTVTFKNALTLQGTGSFVWDGDGVIRDLAPTASGLLMTYLSTTTFSVNPGSIGDTTAVNILTLLATTTKSTSAWAVGSGNGGLDTGAIGASTWYAVYLIKRVDTNVVDVIYSTSGTAPTLPTNYTLYRRIGWVRTNGSSQFIQWQQSGREFLWMAKIADASGVTPANTNRILQTVTAPKGSEGIFIVIFQNNTASGNFFVDVGWTALTDAAASATNQVGASEAAATISQFSVTYLRSIIDSSNQIYYRVSNASSLLTILTLGWIDNL